jgi:hypothetical protein
MNRYERLNNQVAGMREGDRYGDGDTSTSRDNNLCLYITRSALEQRMARGKSRVALGDDARQVQATRLYIVQCGGPGLPLTCVYVRE